MALTGRSLAATRIWAVDDKIRPPAPTTVETAASKHPVADFSTGRDPVFSHSNNSDEVWRGMIEDCTVNMSLTLLTWEAGSRAD
jgi:hypothetical protein